MAYGKNVEGMSGRYKGFHNSVYLRPPSFFEYMFKTPIQPYMMVISPAWKANIRKELQLTNTEGVRFWCKKNNH